MIIYALTVDRLFTGEVVETISLILLEGCLQGAA